MGELSPEAASKNQMMFAAIMQLGTAFWGSKTLLSAVELGVFSELVAAGALDGETLRERLGVPSGYGGLL
jgi:hypothetical protein